MARSIQISSDDKSPGQAPCGPLATQDVRGDIKGVDSSNPLKKGKGKVAVAVLRPSPLDPLVSRPTTPIAPETQHRMDLLEYQAKELFQEVGIPTLPSQLINEIQDLKRLQVPYPLVLKSQVRVGGRGKAGGIRIVTNTIDAIAAAHSIFGLSIAGEYPQCLLAEAKYEAEQELYLAIVIHPGQRRPVLLGSQQGGLAIDAQSAQIHEVIVEDEFSLYYARRLVLQMGLKEAAVENVGRILEQMYRLFVQFDLDLLEINPLAIDRTGAVMALDGKVTLNSLAIDRHPRLLQLLNPPTEQSTSLVRLEGNIGIVSNGLGLAMATLDQVNRAGGKTAAFVNLREAMPGGRLVQMPPTQKLHHWTHQTQERLEQALLSLARLKDVKVILVNLMGFSASWQEITTAIAQYLHRGFQGEHACVGYEPVPIVVRFGGGFEAEAERQMLKELGVPVLDSLEEAVAEGVSLAKLRQSWG
jgi:succinyl-CoA synthetase beta subunit